MGFRLAPAEVSKPKMLLVASVAADDLDGAADYLAGVDAGLLAIPELDAGAEAFPKVSQAAADIPWGGWLGGMEGTSNEAVEQMVKAGCDFVVFPAATTSLAILQDDRVGRILQVEPSLSEGMLRTLNDLPLDAVLVAGEQQGDYPVTWHHLMLFRRFVSLVTKSVLVSVPSNMTARELQTLWDAGVDGVVVAAASGQPAAGWKELRQAIDGLVFPSSRKQGKMRALLPCPGGKGTEVTTEEEEEEEEE